LDIEGIDPEVENKIPPQIPDSGFTKNPNFQNLDENKNICFENEEKSPEINVPYHQFIYPVPCDSISDCSGKS